MQYTVNKLIEELLKVENKNRLVILQKDSEGNGYSPLVGVDDNMVYNATTTYSGEVGLEKITLAERFAGFTEEDLGDGVPCLVLYPAN